MTATTGSVLRSSSLRRLNVTLLLSSAAEPFTLVALLWFVADRGYPAAASGAVMLCVQLPTIAGRLLDRWSTARLMVWDNVLRAGLLVTLAVTHLALLTFVDGPTAPLLPAAALPAAGWLVRGLRELRDARPVGEQVGTARRRLSARCGPDRRGSTFLNYIGRLEAWSR